MSPSKPKKQATPPSKTDTKGDLTAIAEILDNLQELHRWQGRLFQKLASQLKRPNLPPR